MKEAPAGVTCVSKERKAAMLLTATAVNNGVLAWKTCLASVKVVGGLV